MRLPIPTNFFVLFDGAEKKKRSQRYINWLIRHRLSGEEPIYFQGNDGYLLERTVVTRVGHDYIHVNCVRVEDEYLLLLLREAAKKETQSVMML